MRTVAKLPEDNEYIPEKHQATLPVMLVVSIVVSFFAFSNYFSDSSIGSDLINFLKTAPNPNSNGLPMTIGEQPEDDKVQDVTGIVTQALAFKALLSTTQQSTLEQTYTSTLAGKWSNLPCGSTCRNGVQFGNLSATQLSAAQALIAMALSTSGYDEFEDIRIAEDYLNQAGGGSNYTSDLRWIAFLNTPSTSGAWMLQFGGHHYAANIAYNGESVIGATPFFVALEPTTFTLNGTYYEPMEDEREALQDMLASLSSSEFSTAKLSTTFSDVLMAPGESNGNNNTFPTTKQGLQCSSLTTTQKNLVLAAIETYVGDMDDVTAASVLAKYTDELDDTYIAFTGSATAGSASTFLNANSNYVRIDGPSVWIEFACQNGVVISNQIHYHSVWRDHDSDYGVDLTGSSIDNYIGLEEIKVDNIKVFPNPAVKTVNIDFGRNLKNVEIKIFDISGKEVSSKTVSGNGTALNVDDLKKGQYIISITAEKQTITKKIIKE